ncbi:MAG: hypothetical protein EA393_06805 [Bacteroidetes bacterium]|nr:MAG: hypothetical protein EA393_06805 [Bacteroidota bacterium]
MKLFKLVIPGVLFFILLFVSCDIIEPPYMTTTQQNGDNGENGEVEVIHKFLLEEFTGHRCPNCPAGSQIAKTLKNFYGDRLVIVSVHAGFFANPMSEPFNYDFRTPEGTALNNHFGITQNPIGMVNRTEFEGALLLTPASWGSAMQVIEDAEPGFRLDIGITNMSGGNYRLDAGVTSLKDQEGEIYLVALVIEDGIIKPQKINHPDYPDGEILDYVHNHVLRKGITDIWGEKISEGLFGVDDSQHRNYNFNLDSDWVAANCSVVVYVMNSSMEILQVEEKKLF